AGHTAGPAAADLAAGAARARGAGLAAAGAAPGRGRGPVRPARGAAEGVHRLGPPRGDHRDDQQLDRDGRSQRQVAPCDGPSVHVLSLPIPTTSGHPHATGGARRRVTAVTSPSSRSTTRGGLDPAWAVTRG